MRISGQYFEALSSKRNFSTLEVIDGRPNIEMSDGTIVDDLHIQSIQGATSIYFEGGSSFMADEALPKSIIHEFQGRIRKCIMWLEEFSASRLLILALILVAAIVGYRSLLNIGVHTLAENFPQDWELAVGESTYESLTLSSALLTIFEKSNTSPEIQEGFNEIFLQLAADSDISEFPLRLYIHSSPLLGMNAFALPGGIVVLTDGLIYSFSGKEVAAVMAHELAHVEQRHAIRQAIYYTGIASLGLLIFGGADTVIESLSTAVLVGITGAKQSRDFEREADIAAVRILKNTGLDPIYMVNALENFQRILCPDDTGLAECESEVFSWISTHPTIKERIENLKEEIARLESE